MRRSTLNMICGLVLVGATASAQAIAMPPGPGEFGEHRGRPVLSKLEFNVVTEKWVKTSSAKVTANINASVKQAELGNIHAQFLDVFKQLADKGDWHITTFNRSQDSSGLERIYVVAEARLDQSLLADLNTKAKKLTREGRTVTIQDIQFQPTLAETEQARADCRQMIYEQVKAEMAQANNVYPNRHFEVKKIDFQPTLTPQPLLYSKARQMNMMASEMAAAAPAPSLEVSDKVVMSAHVVLADKLPMEPNAAN